VTVIVTTLTFFWLVNATSSFLDLEYGNFIIAVHVLRLLLRLFIMGVLWSVSWH
jgi:hypothetical protein